MMWQELQNSDREVYHPAAPIISTSSSKNTPSSVAARTRNHRSLRQAGGAQLRRHAQHLAANRPGLFMMNGSGVTCLSR